MRMSSVQASQQIASRSTSSTNTHPAPLRAVDVRAVPARMRLRPRERVGAVLGDRRGQLQELPAVEPPPALRTSHGCRQCGPRARVCCTLSGARRKELPHLGASAGMYKMAVHLVACMCEFPKHPPCSAGCSRNEGNVSLRAHVFQFAHAVRASYIAVCAQQGMSAHRNAPGLCVDPLKH